MTTSVSDAIVSGAYIGEAIISPRSIASDIRYLLTGKELKGWTVAYYGRPNRRLCERFGYEHGTSRHY